jgi:hypothetical protein
VKKTGQSQRELYRPRIEKLFVKQKRIANSPSLMFVGALAVLYFIFKPHCWLAETDRE